MANTSRCKAKFGRAAFILFLVPRVPPPEDSNNSNTSTTAPPSQPASTENQNNSARAVCSQALLDVPSSPSLADHGHETDEEADLVKEEDLHMEDGDILQVANDIANEYGFMFHFGYQYY